MLYCLIFSHCTFLACIQKRQAFVQAFVCDTWENCRKPIICWNFKMHASEGKFILIWIHFMKQNHRVLDYKDLMCVFGWCSLLTRRDNLQVLLLMRHTVLGMHCAFHVQLQWLFFFHQWVQLNEILRHNFVRNKTFLK